LGLARDTLDRMPVWVRLVPGVIGVLIVLSRLGFLKINFDVSIVVVVAAGAFLLFAAAAVARMTAGRRGGSHEGSLSLCHVHRVRVEGAEAGAALSRIIEGRARRSVVNFVLASVTGRSGSGNFLFVCGPRNMVEREVDIIEATVSVVGNGVRLERAGFMDNDFSMFLRASMPRGGGEPMLVSMGDERGPEPGKRVVKLGHRLDSPLDEEVYLYDVDVEGHVGVYGSTGMGKSTTLRVLARGLASSWGKVVIVDWTGEHATALATRARVYRPYTGEAAANPLALQDYVLVAEILSSALGLTEPQAFMLSSVLSSTRPEGIGELYRAVAEWAEESKWDREVKRALLRKLSTMMVDESAFASFNLDMVFEGDLVVLDLSGFRSVRGKRAYALTVAAWVYEVLRRDGRGRVVLMFDEAHNVFEGESQVIEEIASEARKYGLSLVYATQSPSLIPNKIILNTNTKIVHALKSLQDKEYVARTMSLGQRLHSLLDKLARGEAVLQAPSQPQPILVKVEG